MADAGMLEKFLDGGLVGDAVFALRRDCRALLVAADGLVPAPGLGPGSRPRRRGQRGVAAGR